METLVSLTFLLSCTGVILAKDTSFKCAACHMLVDELQWEISHTDPNKKIQVGSYRINPDGTQKLSEIPYAGSGIQITDLLETVCTASQQYIQTELDGRKVYVRQNSRHGKPAHLKKAVFSSDNNKQLKFACEGFAEEFEDDIMDILKNSKSSAQLLSDLCVDATEVCEGSELYDINAPAQEMEDLFEKAEKLREEDDDDDDDDYDDDDDDDDEEDSDDDDEEDSDDDDEEDSDEFTDKSSAAAETTDPSKDEL